jgi:hypothetical protein
MGSSRRLAGENIQDNSTQEAERVRKRDPHDVVGAFACVLFCIRVFQIEGIRSRRRLRWGVPEGRLWERNTFFWGWGDELEAEGDVFENGEALGTMTLFARRLRPRGFVGVGSHQR